MQTWKHEKWKVRKMQLVSCDDKTLTIRMRRNPEIAQLLSVLAAVAIDFDKLDPELLTISEDDLEQLRASFEQVMASDTF